MDDVALIQAMLELARECGIDVRVITWSDSAEHEIAPTSAFCRIRGRPCVLLWTRDPVRSQIDVLAQAVVSEAKTELESRYLPPAIRALLDGVSDPGAQG